MVVKNIKTGEQIELMRQAGRVVRLVLNRMGEMAAPGVSTRELDAEATRLCLANGAQCLFKGVPSGNGSGPFPGAICASINEQVVHGIPTDRKLRDGDIISVDFGVRFNGWCGDAAETFLVGNVAEPVRHLVDATRNSLALAISMVKPGPMWSTVARAIQGYIEGEGFSVARDLTGHGIGREMWESPSVPNYLARGMGRYDFVLREGMTIAIEPMANMGTGAINCLEDGWTVVTADGKPSAHFENTVAVTADGAEILTRVD